MLSKEKIYDDIKSIMINKLELTDVTTIDAETDLINVENCLDSIMLMELVVELEQLYSIELSDDDLTTEVYGHMEQLVSLIQDNTAQSY